VPQTDPLIVVSNHASDFDPLIVANCVGRPVAFMAKEELFQVMILSQAIQLYGAYAVKRGTGDRGAMRAALTMLEQGWAAGVFITGTRTPDGHVVAPKLGAAWIAAKAQVPLLPVSLWGTQAIFPKGSYIPRPVPVTIRMGQPILPPASTARNELEIVTQQCADAIMALHELGR
jgi:1-acyl-sn-glycerol-3-phosphate acyltransferase